MQIEIKVRIDTTTRDMRLDVNQNVPPIDLATILSQATTAALMMENQQRALLINPLGSNDRLNIKKN